MESDKNNKQITTTCTGLLAEKELLENNIV